MKTRTKALIPVVALTASKPIARRLAARKKQSHRKRLVAMAAAAFGVAGGLAFWLRHRSRGPVASA